MIKTEKLTCSSQDGDAEEEGPTVEAVVGCAGTTGTSPAVNKGTTAASTPQGEVTVPATTAGGVATHSSLAWLKQQVTSQTTK